MGAKPEKVQDLTDRERRILYYTIHKYIQDSEEVGSRTISKAFGYDMSPATVRNICSDLEDWGYLEQPHTSAGRKPTDRGYRYYLNELLRIQDVAEKQRERIHREFEEKMSSLDDILQKTARLLSSISSHTAVVGHPDLKHFEISRMSLMLEKPDFKNIQTLQHAMQALEEPENIGEIFKQTTDSTDTVDVKIGRELNQPALADFGVIKASYRLNDEITGTFGLVGPKRMPYGRLIATVAAIKDALNSAVRRIVGG